MIHQKQSIWAKYKRWWIIGASVSVGLLILGAVIMWNVLSWADYARKYTSWHTAVHAKTDEVLALPANTAEDREKKYSSLSALGRFIDEGKDICNKYQIIHWQQFIPMVKERIDGCHQIIEKVNQFAGDVNAVVHYLKAEQATVAILTRGKAAKLDEAAWKQQPQLWSEITTEINAQSSPNAFKPVRQLAGAKSVIVRDAWQALVAANEAKDRAKYEEAIGKLAAAYDTFGEIADLSEKTFLPLVASLEKAYQHARP